MSRKPQPKPRVAARIIYDDPALPSRAATATVRCGHCRQLLPGLVRTTAAHPLVAAGSVNAGDFVLSRPGLGLWFWRDGVWWLTAEHKKQRHRTSADLAANPESPRAGEEKARLAQNRFSENPTLASDAFWESPGAAGLILPTQIECANCQWINDVDGNVEH